MTHTEEVAKSIDSKIEALIDEKKRLESARSVLAGGNRTVRSRRRSSSDGTFSSNAERALQVIKDKPGIAAKEIGPALGMNALAGYRLVKQLGDRVRKDGGGGWHAK